ncbi:kinase-regulated stress-responsive transcription factor skn7 [Puccinia graminis f. sp. tritici]|nr:kinase-regulated stress-responsive transcription factor skn7 [Puccinia graminis f. sp. tritici]
MLEEPESESVVGWGAQRTTLVIKDQILFQRDILPKHFKHSNFASFVRQLNKYDFRKIKVSSSSTSSSAAAINNQNTPAGTNPDQQSNPLNQNNNQNPTGSLQWEFYHPYFRADTLSELDHIKRKVPAARQKPAENTCTSHQTECQSTSCNGERTEDIVNRLMNHQIETTSALNQLTKECQSLREKLDQAHNRLDLQQRQIDLLTDPNPRHQASQSYLELTSQSLQNSLTALDQSIETAEESSNNQQSNKPIDQITTSLIMTPTQYFTTNLNSMMAPMPRAPTKSNGGWPGQQPRVLIVEDDQICRRISSTILELMGCRIEFACDGLNAVSRMKTQIDANDPFDLVLMDIFMPNMDGLSATSLIRKFDLKTPIISMTSNFQPVDVLKYINIGMNDCLPKPFTKEGMIIMLQKHLFHTSKGINLITETNESDSVSINLESHPTQQASRSPPGSPRRSQLTTQQSLSSSSSTTTTTANPSSNLPYLTDMNRNPKRPCYSQDQIDFINNNHQNNQNHNHPHSHPHHHQNEPDDHHHPLDPNRFNFNLIDHFHGHSVPLPEHPSQTPQNPHKRFKV